MDNRQLIRDVAERMGYHATRNPDNQEWYIVSPLGVDPDIGTSRNPDAAWDNAVYRHVFPRWTEDANKALEVLRKFDGELTLDGRGNWRCAGNGEDDQYIEVVHTDPCMAICLAAQQWQQQVNEWKRRHP